MQKFEPGDKVKYQTKDGSWKNGVIHGVRKVDDVDGTPRIFTYLIDTGRDVRIDEILTPEGVNNLYERQPEQIDIPPNRVQTR